MAKPAKSQAPAPAPAPAFGIRYQGIELLESHLHRPDMALKDLSTAVFEIKLTHALDEEKAFVKVLVDIGIAARSSGKSLGSLAVGHVFEITEVGTLIRVEDTGKITMPGALAEILNSISISTTRGVMYSAFRGTFLQHAILPIVDPRQLVQE